MSSPALTYKDIASSEGNGFYTARALKYFSTYLEHIDPEQDLNTAHYVAHKMENGRFFIPFLDTGEQWPEARKRHRVRKKDYDKKVKPIRTKMRRLFGILEKLERQKAPAYQSKPHQIELAKLGVSLRKAGRAPTQRTCYRYTPENKPVKVQAATRAKDWKNLKTIMHRKADDEAKKHPESPAHDKIDELCDIVGLDADEKSVVLLLFCCSQNRYFGRLIQDLALQDRTGYVSCISKMTGVSKKRVENLIGEDSPLYATALITRAERFKHSYVLPEFSETIANTLTGEHADASSYVEHITGKPVPGNLDWDESFRSYLGDQGAEMIKYLQGIQKKGRVEKGTNFLFAGPVGTGKTEAIKAACEEVGIKLYVVGNHKKGKKGTKVQPSRHERLEMLVLVQALLKGRTDCAVFFDEMEDIAAHVTEKGTDRSKAHLNYSLDESEAITFFAANDIHTFDAAVPRRMKYSVHFRWPSTEQREKFWKNICDSLGYEMTATDRRNLARRFKAPPSMIKNAVEHVMHTGTGLHGIALNLRAAAQSIFKSPDAIDAKEAFPTENYQPGLLNARANHNEGVAAFSRSIASTTYRNFSLLIHGPAGTGKTEYALWLAEQMNMPVIRRSAVDMLPGMVSTESKIYAVLADARETNSVVLFEDADRFLRDGNDGCATPPVMELINDMQGHGQPVFFTTSKPDYLSQSMGSVFTFDVQTDYLTPRQAASAFRSIFSKRAAPPALKSVPKLTLREMFDTKADMDARGQFPTGPKIVSLMQERRKRRERLAKKTLGIAS